MQGNTSNKSYSKCCHIQVFLYLQKLKRKKLKKNLSLLLSAQFSRRICQAQKRKNIFPSMKNFQEKLWKISSLSINQLYAHSWLLFEMTNVNVVWHTKTHSIAVTRLKFPCTSEKFFSQIDIFSSYYFILESNAI